MFYGVDLLIIVTSNAYGLQDYITAQCFICLQANSNSWQPMQQTWGANWALSSGPLIAPFSIRLTTLSTGKTLIINNAIPQNWQPNATYGSNANFH